jgi:hypothetical protein
MCHRSRVGLGYGGKHRWHQWSKNDDIVARGMNHDDSECKASEVLVIFEVPINREQKVKPPCCQLQQLTVFRTGLAYLGNSLD